MRSSFQKNKSYILACDERGTKSLKSTYRTIAMGGFITSISNQKNLIDTWSHIKYLLCGNEEVELKWSHFFPGHHQKNISNPLTIKDPDEWRHLARWALTELFESSNIFPLTVVVDKDNVSESLLTTSKKGKPILNNYQILGGLIAQFTRFLKENNGKSGEIWFDRLGSKKEQTDLQGKLSSYFQFSQSSQNKYKKYSNRIKPDIKFLDSENEPLIQIADFVSGVIWASVEGDNWFFEQLIENYAPERRKTYGILLMNA